MKLRKIMGITIVALAFMIAAGAEAKSKNTGNLLIPYDGSVAGSHLTSGRYHVEWQTHSPEATVTFVLRDKVIATVSGKVKDRGEKCSNNQVIYDEHADGSREIKEIRFAGSSEIIVFNE